MINKVTKNWFFSVTALFSFAFPIYGADAAQIQFNTDLNLNNATVTENYYAVGGNLNINANFEKDLFVAGGSITIEGEVQGDAIVIGGELNLQNKIDGDLRVVGGTVNISGTVIGDLVVLGGHVNLKEGSNIEGQTILIGGEIFQDAELKNSTNIIAGSVNLNNKISSDTSVTTQRIVFDSKTNIEGSLKYYAPQKATEKDGSKTDGTIIYNEIKTIRETGIVKSAVINFINFWLLLRFVTTLIVAFILVQLFKVFSQSVNDIALKSFVKSFFLGLLALFVTPVVITILLISLIGMPIGFVLLLFYILIITLSGAVSGIVVGSLIANMLGKAKDNKINFQHTVLGIVLLTVLQFIDFLGDVTILIFLLVSIGAMYRFFYRSIVHRT